ncbi:DarT1-associated NADAR antitoxin family protein [Corynebacterium hadale]|uniref:DarT1-associated NADAR antitoxin family protein n=1 Tax=Corynebacterium hadale TaxID=2026255 RepID=UPI00196AA950|nr:hypothetical protein [Corynebacterium hadale]
MAKRPVFVPNGDRPFVTAVETEFEFFSGFASSQKKKSIRSLHEAFSAQNGPAKLLEVSSKSSEELGVRLSAFNLSLRKSANFSVESLFQGSKVFASGGPYTDLYGRPAHEAKRDVRLKNSGELTSFSYFGRNFPLRPTTFFYNWLYINTLALQPDLVASLVDFNAFTDIEFNPKRSINCQAAAVATCVGLRGVGLLDDALESSEAFLEVVYGDSLDEHVETSSGTASEQTTLF